MDSRFGKIDLKMKVFRKFAWERDIPALQLTTPFTMDDDFTRMLLELKKTHPEDWQHWWAKFKDQARERSTGYDYFQAYPNYTDSNRIDRIDNTTLFVSAKGEKSMKFKSFGLFGNSFGVGDNVLVLKNNKQGYIHDIDGDYIGVKYFDGSLGIDYLSSNELKKASKKISQKEVLDCVVIYTDISSQRVFVVPKQSLIGRYKELYDKLIELFKDKQWDDLSSEQQGEVHYLWNEMGDIGIDVSTEDSYELGDAINAEHVEDKYQVLI